MEDRFKPTYYHASTAADDLNRMVTEKESLRDFLIALTPNLLDVSQATLDGFGHVEEVVNDLLLPIWHKAQDALRDASDSDLAEVETNWMGEKLPSYFDNLTPETFRALAVRTKAKGLRQTMTNPATLISQGKLDG